MSEYVIEQGIEIPQRAAQGREASPLLLALKAMGVGDSVFVADMKLGAVRGRSQYAAKLTGFGYSVRAVEGGYRVWRVR